MASSHHSGKKKKGGHSTSTSTSTTSTASTASTATATTNPSLTACLTPTKKTEKKESKKETSSAHLEYFISPSVDDRVKEFAEFENVSKLGKTSDSIVYAVSVVDSEMQRQKLIEDAQLEYSERKTTLKTRMDRARSIYENSKSQREVHEKLLKDAVHLEAQSKKEMDKAKKLMEELANLRDEKLKEEKALEIARSAVHKLAVDAEEKRAHAQAQVLLNKQRMHYAKFLQDKHAQEMDFMDALGKKQLMDLNELEASLNKIEFLEKHAETLIQGSLDYTPAEVDVEVGVQAQHLPTAHIPTEMERAHGASLRTHIIEEVPPLETVKTESVAKLEVKEIISSSHKEETVSAR